MADVSVLACPSSSWPYLLDHQQCRRQRTQQILLWSHADQFDVSRMTICRSWIGATSSLGSVVSSVNAAPPSGIGRNSPPKQNHGSPIFVNFHLIFGDLMPVNS
jgi:hypothetical protein